MTQARSTRTADHWCSIAIDSIRDGWPVIAAQVAGVVCFTLVVKGPWSQGAAPRLPFFQGLVGYFSLWSFGFTFREERERVLGWQVVPVLAAVVAFPILAYGRNAAAGTAVVLLTLVTFITTAVSYVNLISGDRNWYLGFNFVVSALLPWCLVISDSWLIAMVVLSASALAMRIAQVRPLLATYSFAAGGVGVLKSFALHSPLFLLPLFDFLVVDAIGASTYATYVLISKYVLGAFNLFFSYAQFQLAFEGKSPGRGRLVVLLLGSLSMASALAFVRSDWTMAAQVVCFALGTNVASLLVRRQLLDGVPAGVTLMGPAAVVAYYAALLGFGDTLRVRPGTFIALMLASIALASLPRMRILSTPRDRPDRS